MGLRPDYTLNSKTLIYILGPVHHDDLIYLLTGRKIATDFELDSPYSKHVAKTTGLWAAFVQNG